MRLAIPILVVALVFTSAWPARAAGQDASLPAQTPAPTDAEKEALLNRVIANQKKNEQAQLIYERVERVESRKGAPGAAPETKITRAVPVGTGTARLSVGPEG